MDWLFTENQTRKELIANRIRTQENDKGKWECLAHTLRGNCLWSVWEHCNKETETTSRYIALDLLQKQRGYGWGYKDMDESVHPYYYTCPLSYLDMAPVASQDWRDKVIEYHAQLKAAGQFKVGDTVTLIGKTIPQVMLVGKAKRTWIGQYDGRRYRISKSIIGAKLRK